MFSITCGASGFSALSQGPPGVAWTRKKATV